VCHTCAVKLTRSSINLSSPLGICVGQVVYDGYPDPDNMRRAVRRAFEETHARVTNPKNKALAPRTFYLPNPVSAYPPP